MDSPPKVSTGPAPNGPWSPTACLAILACVLFAFTAPVLVLGEVIYPHDNAADVLSEDRTTSDRLQNRKFTDVSRQYVPELAHHLSGGSRSWISTWNPHTQLGRPTAQVVGISKAYPPTLVLSWLTSDAFRLYSLLAALTVIATGAFFFLFLRSLDLHPLACLAGSLGLAAGTYFSYWQSFIMFLSTICWTVCILWLVTAYLRSARPSYLIGIAFACYAMLLSGYPQQIVHQSYVLVVYTLARLLRNRHESLSLAKALLCLVAAVAVGALLTAPVYLDLLDKARLSARLDVPDSFFVDAIPPSKNLRGYLFFFALLFDSFWSGVPIDPTCPVQYGGVSFTPLHAALLPLVFVDGLWRRLWPWLVAAAVAFVLALSRPAFLVAVGHFGFDISRSNPMVTAVVPVLVIVSTVTDHVLRGRLRHPLLVSPLLLAPLGLAFAAFVPLRERYPLDTTAILVAVALVGGAITFCRTRSPRILIVLVIASAFAYGFRLVLRRPPGEIRRTSPLIEAIRERTRADGRYLLVGDRPGGVLQPNIESVLGLSSPHSYDSLSSRAYQEFVLEICPRGALTFGRRFSRAFDDSRLTSTGASLAGIDLILSSMPIRPEVARPVDRIGSLRLYEPVRQAVLAAHLQGYRSTESGVELRRALEARDSGSVILNREYDDRAVATLTPVPRESLLFVSQQFHPAWRATSRGSDLRTVRVNDFFLGVVVPPDTRTIELEFHPRVLWAWIPQALFAIAGAAMIAARLRRPRARS